jgi:hypothetical protein
MEIGTPIGYGGEFEKPLQIRIGLVFWPLGSPDRRSRPGVRPHPTSSDSLSPTSPQHAPAGTSGLSSTQVEAGGKGQESTSRAVHRRWVLPAAMAGVRRR